MILVNNGIKNPADFSEKMLEKGLCIYEVIRIHEGKPIFLHDNLLRLDNSLKKSNISIDVPNLHIPDKLNRLISLNHIQEGNIKYVLHFKGTQSDEYIYQIPHSYPESSDYEKGVPAISCQAVRPNPEVKYLNPSLRTMTNQLIKESEVYEVILVDPEGYITEGSRSNVFFIKEDTFYTAPVQYVLPGTSRKRVIDICKEHDFRVREERVAYATLGEYEAAFITGTSPLILPLCRIDHVFFNPAAPLLQKLMRAYFSLLEE